MFPTLCTSNRTDFFCCHSHETMGLRSLHFSLLFFPPPINTTIIVVELLIRSTILKCSIAACFRLQNVVFVQPNFQLRTVRLSSWHPQQHRAKHSNSMPNWKMRRAWSWTILTKSTCAWFHVEDTLVPSNATTRREPVRCCVVAGRSSVARSLALSVDPLTFS